MKSRQMFPAVSWNSSHLSELQLLMFLSNVKSQSAKSGGRPPGVDSARSLRHIPHPVDFSEPQVTWSVVPLQIRFLEVFRKET